MNHYIDAHQTEGCEVCQLQEYGRTTSSKSNDYEEAIPDGQTSSFEDELSLLQSTIVGFIGHLSLTELISAQELLLANDHAAVAGLVNQCMAAASMPLMGGD